MRSTYFGISIASIVVMLAVLSAAQDVVIVPTTRPLNLSSKEAARTQAEFEGTLSRLHREYSAKVATAHASYLKKLEVIQATETRGGNLEGALSVREELFRQRSIAYEIAPVNLTNFNGRWNFKMSRGYGATIDISPDEVVHQREKLRTRPIRSGSQIVLKWPHGSTDRLTVVGDRMFLEYWAADKEALTTPPDDYGIGERVR